MSVLLDVAQGFIGGLIAIAAYKWTRGKLEKRQQLTGPSLAGVLVYRCPTHGLIESPTWHEDEIQEDSGWYCPINLTGKAEAPHDGITDDVCGKDVSGPVTVEIHDAGRDPGRRTKGRER